MYMHAAWGTVRGAWGKTDLVAIQRHTLRDSLNWRASYKSI